VLVEKTVASHDALAQLRAGEGCGISSGTCSIGGGEECGISGMWWS